MQNVADVKINISEQIETTGMAAWHDNFKEN